MNNYSVLILERMRQMNVAHDLRAPLRHINGFAKILHDRYNTTLDATAQDYLKLIQDAAKNMGQLVDDLLKMGQIGRQELACRPTDLNSLVGRVLRDLQPECEGRQIDWRIAELPSVDCGTGLMRQVSANLLSNAVKYTRRWPWRKKRWRKAHQISARR
jgi:light-regulated signal transduction histidine kinase (bacteriophytochrome)